MAAPLAKRKIQIFHDEAYDLLYPMKIILGDEEKRQDILKKLLEQEFQSDLSKLQNLEYVKTSDQEKYDSRITELVEKMINEQNPNKILAFFGKNRPDQFTEETHYQSFIYKNKMLLCINPSLDCAGQSIYADYFTKDLVNKLNAKLKLKLQIEVPINTKFTADADAAAAAAAAWKVYSQPVKECGEVLHKKIVCKTSCQSHEKEVFCQSWSFYLQYKFLIQIINDEDLKPIDILDSSADS